MASDNPVELPSILIAHLLYVWRTVGHVGVAFISGWLLVHGYRQLGRRCRVVSAASPPSSQRLKVAAQVKLGPNTEEMPLLTETSYLLMHGKVRDAMNLTQIAWPWAGHAGYACRRLLAMTLAQLRFPRSAQRFPAAPTAFTELSSDPLWERYSIRCTCRAPDADIEAAFKAFLSLEGKGVPPDVRTAECLAAECLRRGRSEFVKEIVFLLEKQGMVNTPVLYASLITAYGNTGDVARGLVALEAMKEDWGGDCQALALGYASAVHSCARNLRVDRALKLRTEAARAGVQLGAEPTVALLSAAVQTGRTELTVQIAKGMAAQLRQSEGSQYGAPVRLPPRCESGT